MSSLESVRVDLALVILYLNKAEARDKICRAIQYGSKFLSNGEPGPAQNVDKSTSLARKVFRLFKFVNDLHALISPPVKGTPLPLILLGKSKNALLSIFHFLDQIVWAGRTGIYKNKERAEFLGRIAHYCFLGSNTCTTIIELAELHRLSKSMKKLEKELKHQELYKNKQYRMKLQESNERLLALIKSSLDIVVAVGLLQLAPKKITPRVTGAFGFASSLIACYQVQLIRIECRVPEYRRTTQKVFHFLNFIVNSARSIVFVLRRNVQFVHPEIFQHVLIDLPGLAFFTTYALLARAMSTDGLRPAFYAINGVVYAIQIVLWLVLWWKPVRAMVILSKMFFAATSLFAASAFLLYGGRWRA